jgi:hypothetical protein
VVNLRLTFTITIILIALPSLPIHHDLVNVSRYINNRPSGTSLELKFHPCICSILTDFECACTMTAPTKPLRAHRSQRIRYEHRKDFRGVVLTLRE